MIDLTRTRTLARTVPALASLIAMTMVGLAGVADSADAAPTGRPSVAQNQLIAQARAATARFHDVRAAEDAGYVAVSPCVEAPGLGTMGIHYLNHDRLVDGVLDPTEPELLLYLPDVHGRQRLVGVEYLQVDDDQDLDTDHDRPSLFGVPFDGPMEGHGPGEPVHYDLHVWVWANNPAGMFAPFNPALSCPAAGVLPDPHAGH